MGIVRDEVQVDVIIGGKKAGATLNDLQKEAKNLNAQIRNLAPGTDDFIKKTKELQNVNGRIKSLKTEISGVSKVAGGLGNVFKGAVAALLPLLAIQKAFDFLKGAKENFEEGDRAITQLKATLLSTKNAAGLTKDEIINLAEELQGKTLFPDDVTVGAANLLLTFTNIKKGVFEEALPAIQDIASAMAGANGGEVDLKGASIQVGKALNDPIKGVSALTKVGVSFTDAQKEVIKQMVKTGDTAGAQKLILAELNKEFGGSAEAARKAAGGGFKAFMTTVEDMTEPVGGLVSKGLNKLSDFLLEILDRSEPVVSVFKAFWTEIVTLWSNLKQLINGLGLFNSESSFAQTVVDALAASFTLLLAPVKLVFKITGDLIAKFIELYNSSEVVRGAIGGLGAMFTTTFKTLRDSALKTLGGIGDLLVGIFTLDPEKIKEGLAKSFEGLKEGNIINVAKEGALAFKKGYNDNLNNFIEPKVLEEAEENADAMVAVMEKANEEQLELDKAAQEKLKKQREEYEKKKLDAQRAIEDLRISLIEDSVQREIASLQLNTKRKIEALVGTPEQIAEQHALLYESMVIGIEEIEEKAEEVRKQKRLESFESRIAEEEERDEIDRIRVEDKFNQVLITDEEREASLYELKKAALEERLRLIQEFHGLESIEYVRANSELLALQKQRADQEVDTAKRAAELKSKVEEETFAVSKDFLQLGIELMSQDEEARRENAGAIKAFSVAKIGIDLLQEIGGYMANPASTATLGALGAAKALFATLRAGIAITKVLGTKFEKGVSLPSYFKNLRSGAIAKGPSHARGGIALINNQTGQEVGEIEGNEIIMTAGVYRDPVLRAAASQINHLGGGRKFALGAPINPLNVANQSIANVQDLAGGNTQSAATANLNSEGLSAIANEVRALREDVNRWNTTLKVINDPRDTEEGIRVINELKSEANF